MVRIELQLCVRLCVERESGAGHSKKPAVRLCWAKHTIGVGLLRRESHSCVAWVLQLSRYPWGIWALRSQLFSVELEE